VCGICGIVGVEPPAEAEKIVRRMTAALTHRGPDDEGFLWNDPRARGVALGMRRLSIIDLRGGHQPMWNEARDVAVILNGEIYNFRGLRRTLELCGHCFATQSDTEVLVHAWEEWGEDCLNEIRGMFAFALLDLRKRYATTPLLFLARDPLGIKPLYYTQEAKGFAFASEVRALLAGGMASDEISPDALTSYLLFGSVSEPVTLVEDVYSLPPGHHMVLHAPERRRSPRGRPWWDPQRSPAARDTKKPQDLAAAARCLRPLLEDAVRSHLVADVPVGLFLSSGVDSSAIAAVASRAEAGLHSFTVAFPESDADEAPVARRIAARCGTKHQEVTICGSELLARLEEALGALDQPTMDGVNTYIVSWAARQAGLKVALSGLGGDELFAGYRTFGNTERLERASRIARVVPGPLRRWTAPLVERFVARRESGDAARKAAAAWARPRALPHPYFFARALFPPGELGLLKNPYVRITAVSCDGQTLTPTWFGWIDRATATAQGLSRSFGTTAAVSWLELRTYMASTLLRDTDSVSMNRSLEVRVPLLDRPLVEFIGALPEAARRSAGAQKALLVEALGDLLPPEATAQRKRTFTLPWEQWLRGPLRAKIEASFREPAPALAPHVHAEGMAGVWQAFQEGRTSWSRPWALYVLNEWCRRHLPARVG
jgi:asparagine synthase (glutamine-hydrolysing)